MKTGGLFEVAANTRDTKPQKNNPSWKYPKYRGASTLLELPNCTSLYLPRSCLRFILWCDPHAWRKWASAILSLRLFFKPCLESEARVPLAGGGLILALRNISEIQRNSYSKVFLKRNVRFRAKRTTHTDIFFFFFSSNPIFSLDVSWLSENLAQSGWSGFTESVVQLLLYVPWTRNRVLSLPFLPLVDKCFVPTLKRSPHDGVTRGVSMERLKIFVLQSNRFEAFAPMVILLW